MKITYKLRAAGLLLLTTLIITSARAEDIIETIGGINTLLYGIAAGVAALMITFHAIKWKTAAGPNDREEAKRGIINVILGLILIMIAASLVALLFSKGTSANPVCGNLKCESGETSANCASDCCPDGSSKSTNPTCAAPVSCNKNKNCEPWAGETNAICANDCCPDGTSTSANAGCTNPPGPTVCNKNSACEPPTENSINCPSDCCPDLTSRNTNPTCKPPCNNDKNCGAGENNGNCPNDCCPDGSSKSVNPTCGGGTPTTTTSTTTSTTTTVECLTTKNLAIWIRSKGGKFWHGPSCPWCVKQQNIWKDETPPVGPGDGDLKTITEMWDQPRTPCGGIPCWTESVGGSDVQRGTCQSLPSLCSKFKCPYPNCVGHSYIQCV